VICRWGCTRVEIIPYDGNQNVVKWIIQNNYFMRHQNVIFGFCSGRVVSFSGLGVWKRNDAPQSAKMSRSNWGFGVFDDPIDIMSRNRSIASKQHAKCHRHATDAYEELHQRRKFITETAKVLSSVVVSQHQATKANAVSYTAKETKILYPRLKSTKLLAQYIRNHCNRHFLSSVINSGYKFLYRGLSPYQSDVMLQSNSINSGTAVIKITGEPCDLLDSETYQSDDAAKYFQSLEEQMKARGLNIRPSNGHLATTCPKEASRWGDAASIWPLGERNVDFAWLENGGVFWPIPEGRNEQVVVTSSFSMNGFDNGRQGYKLDDALKGDAWEIMFRADNGFLAVPAGLDAELKQNL